MTPSSVKPPATCCPTYRQTDRQADRSADLDSAFLIHPVATHGVAAKNLHRTTEEPSQCQACGWSKNSWAGPEGDALLHVFNGHLDKEVEGDPCSGISGGKERAVDFYI